MPYEKGNGKTAVIALGGNALGNTPQEQLELVQNTAKHIVDMIQDGTNVVVSHGNGPQVGMIQKAMAELTRSEPEKYIPCPLSVCVAMSQGYIGYDLQNALREELLDRGIQKGVATVLTQVEVDPNDEAFQNPTKPIGAFMTKEEADKMVAERGYNVIEDAGRGYRRVVASPKPVEIVEQDAINSLVDANKIVICCGGGGIPVTLQGDHLKGASAVIDKDFASCLLAKELDADMLIILTAVEKVAVNFGKENEKWLDEMTVAEAQKYVEDVLNTKLQPEGVYMTGDEILDAVLNHCDGICRQKQITFRTEISAHLPEGQMEFAIALLNLLENAIEAEELEEDKLIELQIYESAGLLLVTVRNRISQSVMENNPELRTRKADASLHGLGRKSVKKLIRDMEGSFYEEERNGFFISNIVV